MSTLALKVLRWLIVLVQKSQRLNETVKIVDYNFVDLTSRSIFWLYANESLVFFNFWELLNVFWNLIPHMS